jgi:hypothetical protein
MYLSKNYYKKIKNQLKKLTPTEIVITILFITTAIIFIKYFSSKATWKTVRIEVIKKNWAENYDPYGYKAPFWLSDKIKIGQNEINKSGKVIATVTNIENYERGGEEIDLYLTVKIKTNYTKKTNSYSFKDNQIYLGSAIELNLDNNYLIGQIIDMDPPVSGYQTKQFLITTNIRDVDVEKIKNITLHDKMYNKTDNSIISEIIKIETSSPTNNIYIQNTSHTNFLSLSQNNKNKDVTIKFLVTAKYISQDWYFAGHQNIKVGNNFYFYSPKINLYGMEIVNVEEIK